MSRHKEFQQYYLPNDENIFGHPAYDSNVIKKMALGDLDRDIYASRGNIFSKARRRNSSGSQIKKWNLLGGSTTIERFGGNGSDGELIIRSGTTTINAASAAVVVKQYTKLEISGTGKLTISNAASTGTILVLKVQGDVILTSSTSPLIDLKGFGATGGAGVASGTDAFGNDGTAGKGNTHNAPGGSGGTASAGSGGVSEKINLITGLGYPIIAAPGGGGGSGGYGATTGGGLSGAGGTGGGALIIECGGRYRCTGTLSVAGNNGGNSTAGVLGVGGGGAGAGGTIVILYNTLITDTGTYTVAGGSGGTGNGAGNLNFYGGGGGASLKNSGSAGVVNGGSGGAAGNGEAVMMENRWIA